jgi:hypothetical protein
MIVLKFDLPNREWVVDDEVFRLRITTVAGIFELSGNPDGTLSVMTVDRQIVIMPDGGNSVSILPAPFEREWVKDLE